MHMYIVAVQVKFFCNFLLFSNAGYPIMEYAYLLRWLVPKPTSSITNITLPSSCRNCKNPV